MKFIFDFDDVLFNNTKQFKPHMFECISRAGVPENEARAYYLEVRENEFSLKDFLSTLFTRCNINKKKEEVYEEIIRECKNFVNVELIEIVKKLGKDNCYLVTNGEYDFNKDKVERSGISPLFREVIIVPASKKEIIYDLCKKHKNEKVIFIDDKPKFIDDIDMTKCPNLKTILYTGQSPLSFV